MAVAVMPFTIRLATSEAVCKCVGLLSASVELKDCVICNDGLLRDGAHRWPEGRENQGLEKINYRVLQNILLSLFHISSTCVPSTLSVYALLFSNMKN